MKQTPLLIAVLDDEPEFCKALGRLLKSHGFGVITFAQGQEFLAACAVRLPNCLLLDLHMPGMSGFEVLERIATLRLKVPAVVITGHDQPGNAARVRKLGVVSYLLKPINDQAILNAINLALGHKPTSKPGNSETK
jgi:FixJ family two-component response regulator